MVVGLPKYTAGATTNSRSSTKSTSTQVRDAGDNTGTRTR